jgi:hypothetical protein
MVEEFCFDINGIDFYVKGLTKERILEIAEKQEFSYAFDEVENDVCIFTGWFEGGRRIGLQQSVASLLRCTECGLKYFAAFGGKFVGADYKLAEFI